MLPPDFIIHNRYRIIYAADERPGSKLYRGREDQTGRLVLIAALPYEDDTAREDLELLGRQVAAVRHEGILPIVDQFSEQGTFYLVCTDPGGQDLERVLRARGGPLPEADTLKQARQMLNAIALLHSQRPPIYLGDPSPADIWIPEDGAWRLAPFALIRRIGHAPSPYRAPELAAADAEPSSASDLYALNALLYQAITGWAPPSPEQQQAGTPLNGPRVLNPALSTLAEQALLRGLQLRAENRYQAAREMSLALETVQMMDGRSLGAGPNVVPTAAPVEHPAPATPPPAPIAPGPPPGPPAGAYSAVPPAATLPPGPPYQPGVVPASEPKQRFSTGCMIALAVALTLLAVGICIGLALVIPGSPLSAWLAARGNAPSATDTPPTAPAGAGQAPTAEQTAGPTATTPGSGEPIAAAAPTVELGPNAITLQTAGQITQTDEITGVISGPVAYAPDGKTLAIGISNVVNLRDAETLDDLDRLEGHTGQVSVIVWSPDSKLLASGAVDDPIIRVWDPASGELVHELTGHSGWIRSMAFSPDGSLLASGSNDQTIRIWDPAGGAERQTLEGHSAMIGGVAFSPDSKSLASGSRDGSVRLWDVATGRERSGFNFQTELNPNPIEEATPRFWTTGVAFSPDGETLAVGATDGLIYLLDAATGRELRQLQGHTGWVVIRGVVFSPDGTRLATASLDGTIRLWDPATGVETGTLRGHRLQILSISFSPDGERLASTSDEEGQMLIWDVAQQQVGSSLRIGQGLITALAFSADGGVLGMVGYNGTLRLYEIDSRRSRSLTGSALASQALLFLPDNRMVAITDQDTIAMIEPGNSDATTLEGLDGRPLNIAASRAGTLIAAGSDSGAIGVWDGATGEARPLLRGALPSIYALAVSDDGTRIAAAGPPNDPRIEVWDVAAGTVERTLDGPSSAIVGLEFQPGGPLLAAAEIAGGLGLWDTGDGRLVQTISASAEQQNFSGMTISPDGAMVATSSPNGEVRLYSASTGTEVMTVAIQGGGALALEFSPDGQRLAVSVRDETVRIFEVPGR